MPGGLNLAIGAGATLVINAGEILTYTGSVAIAPTGNLVLAAVGSTGAKIEGVGIITAGATTFRGDWEAASTADGTLTIASGAGGIGATITASAATTTLKASAAGAGINQAAGTASNSLTIGANTTLDLNAVASITLASAIAADNPGTLTLNAATSIILTGADATPGGALTAAAGLFVTTAADDKALCNAIAAATGVAIYPGTTATTQTAKIAGGSAPSTIKATAASAAGGNIVLDKDSPVS